MSTGQDSADQGAVSPPPSVTAVLLVRGDGAPEHLHSTLWAIDHQTRRPERLLAVLWADADDAARGTIADAAGSGLVDAVIEVEAGTRLHDAVSRAIVDVPGSSPLWLLERDSAPGRRALEQELALLGTADGPRIVGAKLLARPDRGARSPDARGTADEADALVRVGITLTRSARIVSGADDGEIDQGQADREDVLAADLPGMLLTAGTLRDLGGFDPALDAPWGAVELGHRARRRGADVRIAPRARVIAAEPTSHRADRRARILTHLAIAPRLRALLLILALPIVTAARMAAAVVAHRPSQVWDELVASLGALIAAPGVLRRSSRGARVRRSRLAPYFRTRRDSFRADAGRLWTSLVADDDRSRRIRRTTWGIAGTSHGMRDADYGRHSVWTLVLVVLAAGVGAVGLRPLIGRGALIGPSLVPLPDGDALAQAAWAPWLAGGLGASGRADPLTRLLGVLPLPPEATLEAIVLGALPLSALTAWWAAGALTRAIGARLALASGWALAPAALASLAEGRWPLLLVHVLLPVWALAVGRAIGLVHKRSQASAGAAAAAGLVLLVISAVQPVLLILAGIVLLLIAPFVPGRRLRLLWTVVPSLALLAPYLPSFLSHPELLLAVSGIAETPDPAPAGLAILGLWPSAAPSWDFLAPWLGAGAARWAPVAVLAPFAAAALAAPFLASIAGRAARLGWVVVAIALGTALLTGPVIIGVHGGSATTVPLGGLMSVATAGLLVAAACTFDALARRDAATRAPRRTATSAVAGIVAVLTAATVAAWCVALPGALRIERGEREAIPAAAADQGRSATALRTLVLAPQRSSGATTDVTSSLIVDGGDSIAVRSTLDAARDAQAARRGALDSDPGSRALASATSGMVGGDPAAAVPLRTLAVGFVFVPASTGGSAVLESALDRSPVLEKVTSTDRGALWRVIDARSRVGVTVPPGSDEAGHDAPWTVVPSELISADGSVAPAPRMRVVSLSERASSAWSATLDGRALEPVTIDGWAQGFEIPEDAHGALEIRAERPSIPYEAWLLAIAVAVTALVAIPWRGRAVKESSR